MEDRKRAIKFSQEELLLLGDQTEKYAAVLFSENITATEVDKYWKLIATAISAVHGNNRTAAQVKKKASNLRSQAKQKASHNKKEFGKTGGGEAEIAILSQIEEKFLNTVPKVSYEGIPGGLDTSGKSTDAKARNQYDYNKITNPMYQTQMSLPRQTKSGIRSFSSFARQKTAQERPVSDCEYASDASSPDLEVSTTPTLILAVDANRVNSTSKPNPYVPSPSMQLAENSPGVESLRTPKGGPSKLRYGLSKRKSNFNDYSSTSSKKSRAELPSMQEMMMQQVELLKQQIGYFAKFEELFQASNVIALKRNEIEEERNEILRFNYENP